MKLRCKFEVTGVSRVAGGFEHVALNAVYVPGEEAQGFAKERPSGNIMLMVDRAEVKGQFEPSQEYYMDLTPVVAK